MKALDKRIKAGTKVMCDCCRDWHVVKEIHESGKHLKTSSNHGGTWQSGHVVKFRNVGVGR